jgi:hypothetical protein
MHKALSRILEHNHYAYVHFFEYSEFKNLEQIGAGNYGTIYKAECESLMARRIVLKRFKNFDRMPEVLANEVSNHWIMTIIIM